MPRRVVLLILIALLASSVAVGHDDDGLKPGLNCPACQLERSLGCGFVDLADMLVPLRLEVLGFISDGNESLPYECLPFTFGSPRSPPVR